MMSPCCPTCVSTKDFVKDFTIAASKSTIFICPDAGFSFDKI